MTLVEIMVSMLIVVISVSALYSALSFVSKTAKRSTEETEGNMQAIRVLELLSDASYDMTTTNNFPIEYLTDTEGELIYALTTSIYEVTSPDLHKQITLDYTWREGVLYRHTRYYLIKTD